MAAIIAIALAVIVGIVALSFVAHLLFSPLVLVAIAIVAWIKLRPSRSHR